MHTSSRAYNFSFQSIMCYNSKMWYCMDLPKYPYTSKHHQNSLARPCHSHPVCLQIFLQTSKRIVLARKKKEIPACLRNTRPGWLVWINTIFTVIKHYELKTKMNYKHVELCLHGTFVV